jgi:tetratricopeptide (TPR) repeat protein
MMFHSLLRCSLPFALAIGLCAQVRPPSPGMPTSPSNPSNPSSNSTTTMPGPTIPTTLPGQRPLFLMGKIVLEDGTPPPDPVSIQIICRSSPRSIGFTDMKGNFSVDLGDRNTMPLADASERGDGGFGSPSVNPGSTGGVCPGEPSLMGAQVRASLPGFRSDVVDLGARRSMDDPNVGTLVLHRLSNVEGLTISATSALAPKDAKKALEKARADEAKQKWDSAEKELEKAVSLYPKYASAWLELGNVQQQLKDLEGARKSYGQALAADPKFVSPYLQLAVIAANEQKWQEVADDTDHLLHLNPVDFPQAWLFNTLANYYMKKMDLAEKSAREGISHDPAHRYPKMNYVLGLLLAQKRDYSASAQNLREYLQYAPHASDVDEVRKQLAEVEKVAGPEAQK